MSAFSATPFANGQYMMFGGVDPDVNQVIMGEANELVNYAPWLSGVLFSGDPAIHTPFGTGDFTRYRWDPVFGLIPYCEVTRRHVYFNENPWFYQGVPPQYVSLSYLTVDEGVVDTPSLEGNFTAHDSAFHDPTPVWYWLGSTAIHEVGHVAGLGHLTVSDSGYALVMNPLGETLNQGDVGTSPLYEPVDLGNVGGIHGPHLGDVLGLRARHGGGSRWSSLAKYDIRTNRTEDDYPPDDTDHSWWMNHIGLHKVCIDESLGNPDRYDHVYLEASPVSTSADDYTVRFSILCVDSPVNTGPGGENPTCSPGQEYLWKDIEVTNVALNDPTEVHRLRPSWVGVELFPDTMQQLFSPFLLVPTPAGRYRLKARVLGTNSDAAVVHSNSLYDLEDCAQP
ncbi:MAG: hypothetical protein R3F61_25130 [Myxococcota bacterium]